MNSNEIIRLRRQMQRRIRDVVAERRLSRQNEIAGAGGSDRNEVTQDPLPALSGDDTLIAG